MSIVAKRGRDEADPLTLAKRAKAVDEVLLRLERRRLTLPLAGPCSDVWAQSSHYGAHGPRCEPYARRNSGSAEPRRPQAGVMSLRFDPTGKFMATGSLDKQLCECHHGPP